jgi:hypothetical protein
VEAALSIFDGGWPDLPEDEREGAWQDPLEGETPGRPRRTVDDLDEWKTDMDWPYPEANLKWDDFYDDED